MTFVNDAQVAVVPRYQGKGRPAKGRKPDAYVYRIEGGVASMLQERARRLERKSCFILATNQLNCEALSDEDLPSTGSGHRIAAYKDQQKAVP